MNVNLCDNRDGYLGKWLTPEEELAFAAHLEGCAACRQAVEEERRLDDLLIRANATLLPVPTALTSCIERKLRQARRRRVVAWAVGLAAAVVLGFVSVWVLPQREAQRRSMPPDLVAAPAPQPEPARDPRTLVQVTFSSPSDVIAVPQNTEDLSVTIIWVYPTIKTAQEPGAVPFDGF